WAVALGLVEQVAHAAGADTNEHLDKFRARDAEERHARLAADSLREQRLTGAGVADQQHALRDTRAKLDEALGVLQKFYDLAQFLFSFVRTGHVVKRHGGLVAGEHPRAALPKRHRLIIRPLR